MRAPPEAGSTISAASRSAARRAAATSASPTASPIDPPMKPKSKAAIIIAGRGTAKQATARIGPEPGKHQSGLPACMFVSTTIRICQEKNIRKLHSCSAGAAHAGGKGADVGEDGVHKPGFGPAVGI